MLPSPLLQAEKLHKNARQSRKLCAIACLPTAAPPRLNYIPAVRLPVTAAGIGLHQDSDTSDDGPHGAIYDPNRHLGVAILNALKTEGEGVAKRNVAVRYITDNLIDGLVILGGLWGGRG